MASLPQQFVIASKAQLEAQLRLMNALTAKAFEGAEKILELNLGNAQTSFDSASAVMKEMGNQAARQQSIFTAMERATPNPAKTLDCSRELTDIAAALHTEFSKAAEVQVAETTRTLTAVIDETAQSIPAGAQRPFAMMRAMIDNVNVGYRQLSRNMAQAVDTTRFGMNTFANLAARAAEGAARMRGAR